MKGGYPDMLMAAAATVGVHQNWTIVLSLGPALVPKSRLVLAFPRKILVADGSPALIKGPRAKFEFRRKSKYIKIIQFHRSLR